jgi:hypothetical protein
MEAAREIVGGERQETSSQRCSEEALQSLKLQEFQSAGEYLGVQGTLQSFNRRDLICKASSS